MSALLVLLSAAILLLFTSPLPLTNLLQPVQAQTPMSFRTPTPANAKDPSPGQESTLTFDAQGTTTNSSDNQPGKITNGTFQITSKQDGKILLSGHVRHGQFYNNSRGASILVEV
jgi:hypothetical protein